MTTPIYTADEARDRETFLALMWSLSYPGRIQALPGAANTYDSFVHIGQALLDLESSFYTPDAALASALGATGARALPPTDAAYHFYPALTDAAHHDIRLGGIPARFWSLRARAPRYPLGWDVCFVDHGSVISLPRTTQVAEAR